MMAVLLVFAAIQFTNVVDNLIAMPLGVQITAFFSVSSREFSYMVSAYAVGAGLSALVTGFFVDKLSRRKLLLLAYVGFALGTVICGLAPSFALLVAARAVTGVFAGLTAPLIMALISEGFPEEKRGGALGTVMAGFALASVLGVPLGLHLALLSSWRLPFLVTGALAVLVWPACYWALSRLRNSEARDNHTTTASLGDARHLQAFLLMIFLTIAQMAIVPFLGPFLVKTTGLPNEQLPTVFGVAGALTLIVAPLVGSFSDRLGRRRVYTVIDFATVVVIIVLTHLSRSTVYSASALVALFMALIAGRYVVATALVTAWVEPKIRAGFFSFNSAFQQLAAGFAALLGGFVLHDQGARVEGYSRLGWIAVAFSVVTAIFFHRIARKAALLFLAVAFVPSARAERVSFSRRTDLSAFGLYRYINEAGLTENQTPKDGVFVGQFLADANYKNFELEFQPEYIHHVGDGVGPSLLDPASLSLAPPKRFLPWERKLKLHGHQEAYLDVERLNLAYQDTNYQAYVGRKPVSLGTLKLFPVWNKFTRPSPIAVGPEAIVFNQDGAGLRAQFGEVSVAGTEVKGSNTDQDATLGEVAWFNPQLEVHALASKWWQATVYGVALAKDIAGASIRAEGLAIGPDKRTQTVTSLGWRGQAGLGGEYAFTDKFSVIMEGLWQQNGATSVDQYQLANTDPFQILRARWYSIEQLKYKFSNKLTASGSLVGNWVDYSQYGLFNADWSFNQATDLILTISGPLGKKGLEFSARTFDFPDGSLLGAPFQMSLALQTTF